jgi:cytochrome c oxidase cbb3-type subunit 3
MTTNITTITGDIPEPSPAEARLIQHAYDGIREYDNPLPGWWSAIFWATIVFAAGYAGYYHVAGWGKTPDEKYALALADYQDRRGARDLAEAANVDEAGLAQRAVDPTVLASGRAVFVARCASCHTEDGRGLIGPNLTDHFQLHGESRMDIYNTVKKGVPGTAMLAWGEQLGVNEVVAVSAYVTTLRGQNLPGKAREGSPVRAFAP